MNTNTPVTIRRAALEDVPAITDIYNEAILTSAATFDIDPRTVEDRMKWFQDHHDRH
jgi:L-amino acid N-acyltransferase